MFSCADPAVDLDVHRSRQQRAQLADPLERLRHERLARVAGVDAHAEDEVDARLDAPRPRPARRSVSGLKASPTCEAVLARERDDVREVRGTTSRWTVTLSAAGLGDLLEVLRRVVDHQVAVERRRRASCTSGAIDSSTIGPIVTGGTKWPSPTSKWKTRTPAREQRLDLLAEPREVGRVERRLDLDAADPVVPQLTRARS